jgi:hypothetical protein
MLAREILWAGYVEKAQPVPENEEEQCSDEYM